MKLLKQVIKASGAYQNFDEEKIYNSIWVAAENVGGKDEKTALLLKEEVVRILSQKYPNGEYIKTSEIGEIVEKVLIERGHAKTAKEFISVLLATSPRSRDSSSFLPVGCSVFSWPSTSAILSYCLYQIE